jgi:hypothetical protein
MNTFNCEGSHGEFFIQDYSSKQANSVEGDTSHEFQYNSIIGVRLQLSPKENYGDKLTLQALKIDNSVINFDTNCNTISLEKNTETQKYELCAKFKDAHCIDPNKNIWITVIIASGYDVVQGQLAIFLFDGYSPKCVSTQGRQDDGLSATLTGD